MMDSIGRRVVGRTILSWCQGFGRNCTPGIYLRRGYLIFTDRKLLQMILVGGGGAVLLLCG